MSHYDDEREADEIWKNTPEWAVNCLKMNIYIDDPIFSDDKHMQRLSRLCGVQRVTLQRDTKPDWSKAPAEATHYADGSFLQRISEFDKQFLRYNEQTGLWNAKLSGNIECYPDYQERPQTHQEPTIAEMEAEKRAEYNKRFALKGATKPHQNEPAPLKPQNPYQRTIIGLDGSKCVVDVYRVLDAFKTDSPALDHAIKKILCPGTRHQKDREQDLKEAIKSIEAELLLMEQKNGM